MAIPLSFVIIPLSFLLARFFGAGEDIIWVIIPEIFIAALGLGMRGTPAGAIETALTLGAAFIILFSRIFAIGAFIGWLYGKCKTHNMGALFLGSLALLLILLLGFSSYATQDPWAAYDAVQSPDECDDTLKRLINNFDTNRCYLHLAVNNKNISVCDHIKKRSSIEKAPEDFKWFCYEEVAHAADDVTLCELIQEETYNKHGVSTGRRDVCFRWFGACDRISDSDIGGWKDDCLKTKASTENDPSWCENITNNFYKDSCFLTFNICDRITRPEMREQCLNGRI